MKGVAGSGVVRGSVQTVVCCRDGREVWRREVWVPRPECDAFYRRFLAVAAGPFVYDCVGDIRRLARRPAGVPHWDE